jgi:hypothetical protein
MYVCVYVCILSDIPEAVESERVSSIICITIIDTIILYIYTNDAYTYDTYDTYLRLWSRKETGVLGLAQQYLQRGRGRCMCIYVYVRIDRRRMQYRCIV